MGVDNSTVKRRQDNLTLSTDIDADVDPPEGWRDLWFLSSVGATPKMRAMTMPPMTSRAIVRRGSASCTGCMACASCGGFAVRRNLHNRYNADGKSALILAVRDAQMHRLRHHLNADRNASARVRRRTLRNSLSRDLSVISWAGHIVRCKSRPSIEYGEL